MSTKKEPGNESVLKLRDNWIEPVSFSVKVVDDGNCRVGHKVGQEYTFTWGAPEGLCTESLVGMYPILQSLRVFGDMRLLGSSERNVRVYNCPSREIKFRIEALSKCNLCGNLLQINENGVQSHQLTCAKPEFPLRVCANCHLKYKDRRIEW